MLTWLKNLFSPRPTVQAMRESMRFVGRARWIVHLFDALGEQNSEEFAQADPPVGYEDVLVFAFAPTEARPWWTYITAGMSISPALDACPPTELCAYAQERTDGLVELLFQLAFRPPGAIPLASGDLVRFEAPPPDLGMALGQDIGLVESDESGHLLRFPDVSLRPEDQRYVLARPGEDATPIRLLRVIALHDGDADRFAAVRASLAGSKAWRLW